MRSWMAKACLALGAWMPVQVAGQTVQHLPAVGLASYQATIPSGGTTAAVQVLLDSVRSVDLEILESRPTEVALVTPSGEVMELRGGSGTAKGLSYSVHAEPGASVSRILVRLSAPKAGLWQVRCSLPSGAPADIQALVICHFSDGPQTMFYLPSSLVLGRKDPGYLYEVDGGRGITGTVQVRYTRAGAPGRSGLPARPLPVIFDGKGYRIDLASLPGPGDYDITYAVTGSGSNGPFARNGGGRIKVLPLAAAYAGSYSVSYDFAYGDR